MDFVEIAETSKVFHNSVLEEDDTGKYRIRLVKDLGGSKVPEKYQSLVLTETGWDLISIHSNRESALLSCAKHQIEEDELVKLFK